MKAFLPLLIGLLLAASAAAGPELHEVVDSFQIAWAGYSKQAHVVRGADGETAYAVTRNDGTMEILPAGAFAQRVAAEQHSDGGTSPIFRLLNARTTGELAWILFGLAGQTLFAGRMIVQWIVSERHKRSIVPPIFWWLSVSGSAMLFTYFFWRGDIVGILGQGLPLMIYVRNLMLIYGRPAPPTQPAGA